MFVVIRRPHTNISKAADLLRFSRSAISNFFIKITEEEIKKKKYCRGRQYSVRKSFIDKRERGRMVNNMANLVGSTTLRTLNQTSYGSRRPRLLPLLSDKKPRLHYTNTHKILIIEDWENVA